MFKTRYRIAERSKGWFQLEKKRSWSSEWLYVSSHPSLKEAEEAAEFLINPFIKYL